MKTDMKPMGALRLEPCTYGLSKVPFRGPRRPTDKPFVAMLGGSDTFAKYVQTPFPDLIENAIGEVCVNLGCQSAGPDVFLQDAAVQSLCHDAAVTVIQIVGVTNQTNPFYKVHPRRNDRFIAPTDRLRALYPEMDFAEISFTGHLIEKLRATDEDRFVLVRDQLQKTWLKRMKALIAQSGGPVILLWLAPHPPNDCPDGGEPAFVTDDMMVQLQPSVAAYVEVCAQAGNTFGLSFAPLEAISAAATFGRDVHENVAKALRPVILQLLA